METTLKPIQQDTFKKNRSKRLSVKSFFIALSLISFILLSAGTVFYFINKKSDSPIDFSRLIKIDTDTDQLQENNNTPESYEAVILQNTITRAEIADYLVQAFNLSTKNPSKATFSDVPISHPQYKAIETFFAKEITTGCAINPLRFCPERIATRAEAITYIIRIMGLTVNLNPKLTNYTDAENHPLQPYIKYAKQIGLSLQCEKGVNYFCPDDPITGSQLKQLISNAKFIQPERPQRWIQPNYHPDKFTVWETALEYPELWDNTFKNVDVLGLFIYSIDANPKGYLDKVADIVKKYNLKINVEMFGLMMTTSCGDKRGEESAELALKLIQPLYDHGLQVDYIALDASGLSTRGCPNNITMDQYIAELIQFMQLMHIAHPEIKFGLLPNFPWWPYQEGLNYFGSSTQNGGDYYNIFNSLISQVETAGEKIHFVLVDTPYEYAIGTGNPQPKTQTDWMQRIVNLENQVESKGIMFGLIYNTANSPTEEKYYTGTMKYRNLYKQKGGTPSIMMLESWEYYPRTYVPDYQYPSFTNLVANFFEFATSEQSRILTRKDAAKDIIKFFKMDLINTSTSSFTDVTKDDNLQEIETLYKNNITTGCGVNPLRFCPNRQLTRGEAVTFLLRGSKVDITPQNKIKFSDVSTTYPLYKYIIFAAENNITSGCNSSTKQFCPNDLITLGEWANLTTRVLDYYYSKRTCPKITRCGTEYDGYEISYIPDARTDCYDFKYFPVYPLWGRTEKMCPTVISNNICLLNSNSCSICKKQKSCCTIKLGLEGKNCN